MPPLPPNMARQTIIKTTPSLHQRHFARKDNHIRFITRRFPNKPRDDPGLPNPPLPPGASRLAFHTGSTGLRQHNPISHQWVAIAEVPPNPTDQTKRVGLAISDNSETLVVGYPLDSSASVGEPVVKAFTYSEDGGLVQKGTNITFPDTSVYTDRYAAGHAVAVSNTGNLMIVGDPTVDVTDSGTRYDEAGNAQTLNYFPLLEWKTKNFAVYEPVAASLGVNYGWSTAISDYDSTNSVWYTAIGSPIDKSFSIITLSSDGAIINLIGGPSIDATKFRESVGTELLGYSTSISNIQGGTTIYIVAGAPYETSGTAFVRIIKGVLSGTPATDPTNWSWTTQQDITSPITTNSYFGRTVAMTLDGSIIIVGDKAHDKAYVYASTDGWSNYSQLGQDFQGASSTGFGHSVAIDRYASATNPEGTTIVISQPEYSDPIRPNCGRVLIFEYINGGWKQVLNAVTGNSENEKLGQAIAMRSSEAFLAAGSQASGRVALFSVREV